MNQKRSEYDQFIDALVDELIARPDGEVLAGLDQAAVLADGQRLLRAAKLQAGRARLAAAKSAMQARGEPAPDVVAMPSVTEARQFIARAANDPRYTMAARKLEELSDDEVLQLYQQLKSLGSGSGSGSGEAGE